MSQEENSYLRKEIDRLNRIITVLLEQNAHLKQDNAHVKTVLGIPPTGDSDVETDMGITTTGDSYAETGVGIRKDADSQAKTDMGIPPMGDSYAETGVGIRNVADSQPKTGVGIPPIGDSHVKTGMGIPFVPKPLPETWVIDDSAVKRVSARLKEAGFGNVKKSGKRNIALVLLHFYNKGRGGYAELHKLTKLSEGGVGKLVMSLKKRKVIYTISYRQYGLSGATLNMLQKAYNDVDLGWHQSIARRG